MRRHVIRVISTLWLVLAIMLPIGAHAQEATPAGAVPSQGRLYYVRYALKMGWTVDQIHELTNYDPWFIARIREIVDAEFVGLGQNSALQEHLRRHAARMGKTLKLRVRMGSFDAVCRLVAQGVSLGVVPEMAAHRCAASMPIRVIPLTDAWALRHLTICLRRLDLLSLQARMLVGVRGAGLAYDGLYYVKSVTHNFKRGEYKQSFTLSRNALVSTMAKVPA